MGQSEKSFWKTRSAVILANAAAVIVIAAVLGPFLYKRLLERSAARESPVPRSIVEIFDNLHGGNYLNL